MERELETTVPSREETHWSTCPEELHKVHAGKGLTMGGLHEDELLKR